MTVTIHCRRCDGIVEPADTEVGENCECDDPDLLDGSAAT